MTRKRIKILDNHKIPRKFRKGFNFYTNNYKGEIPQCAGDNWRSKNTYLSIVAVPIGKLPIPPFTYFNVKKPYTVAL